MVGKLRHQSEYVGVGPTGKKVLYWSQIESVFQKQPFPPMSSKFLGVASKTTEKSRVFYLVAPACLPPILYGKKHAYKVLVIGFFPKIPVLKAPFLASREAKNELRGLFFSFPSMSYPFPPDTPQHVCQSSRTFFRWWFTSFLRSRCEVHRYLMWFFSFFEGSNLACQEFLFELFRFFIPRPYFPLPEK